MLLCLGLDPLVVEVVETVTVAVGRAPVDRIPRHIWNGILKGPGSPDATMWTRPSLYLDLRVWLALPGIGGREPPGKVVALWWGDSLILPAIQCLVEGFTA